MKRVILTLMFLTAIMVPSAFSQADVKEPNVSGQFYPADAETLSKSIDAFFALAQVQPYDKRIDMIIAPHAGYVYSGPVAAYAYKAISHQKYSTVIIIAVSHFSNFEGFAIWPRGNFETPLGRVEVDAEFSQKLLSATDKIKSFSPAFDKEHSLEVQLPFLQKTLTNFKIVSLLTGKPNFDNCRKLAVALNQVIGNREDILIVVSTDMSHYYNDPTARRMDAAALSLIKNFRAEQLWTHCLLRNVELCGFSGVTTALLYASLRNMSGVDILRYATSADATGDKSAVVGYGAAVFYKKDSSESTQQVAQAQEQAGQEKNQPVQDNLRKETGGETMVKKEEKAALLNAEQKKKLIDIAQKTIFTYIQKKETLEFNESDPRLSAEEGAFVTIHKRGELRGCIGNILGQGPLYKTIRNMAIAAATEDPRFPPVTADELKDIDIEISVLSKPRRIKDVSEIQMGVHGVIVGRGLFNRGVFLPQVATETGWSREEFLSNLCAHKAGLPPDAWKDPQTTMEIFTAQVFSQKDVK